MCVRVCVHMCPFVCVCVCVCFMYFDCKLCLLWAPLYLLRPYSQPFMPVWTLSSCLCEVGASVVAGCERGVASAGAGRAAAGALPFLALPGPGQPRAALRQ